MNLFNVKTIVLVGGRSNIVELKSYCKQEYIDNLKQDFGDEFDDLVSESGCFEYDMFNFSESDELTIGNVDEIDYIIANDSMDWDTVINQFIEYLNKTYKHEIIDWNQVISENTLINKS